MSFARAFWTRSKRVVSTRPPHSRPKLVVTPAIAALIAACSGPPQPDQTLQLALKTAPNKLDPAAVVDVAEGEICALMFQGLVRFSPRGEVVPDLAKSWKVESGTEGGAKYVFHLDRRMRFSDGRPVTSQDVVYSFERVLGPGSRSPRKWVLSRIRGAQEFAAGASALAGLSAPDDSTVVVELDEPFNPFLSMLALPAAMVVSREPAASAAAEEASETAGRSPPPPGVPVGSGAWRLVSWQRGDYLSLAPNPHYPRPPVGIPGIRFRIIPEAFTRVAEFESGTLDILDIPPAELGRFLDNERFNGEIQSRAELRVYYIGLNNARAPFTDARVRRALNHAVDVDRLIDVLARGQAIRSAGAIPPGLRGYVKRPAYAYDPAEARRLLADAGYSEGFAMEIWQRESPEGNRVLEAVQGYLAQVGVEVKLVRREWSAFKEAVSAGRVDAFYLDWFADYPSAENFIAPLFHSRNVGGGGNRSFFSDPTIDEMIDAAGREIDDEISGEMYARIDSLIYERAPWIYLYFPKAFRAVSSNVSGYQLPTLYLGNDYSNVTKMVRKR